MKSLLKRDGCDELINCTRSDGAGRTALMHAACFLQYTIAQVSALQCFYLFHAAFRE